LKVLAVCGRVKWQESHMAIIFGGDVPWSDSLFDLHAAASVATSVTFTAQTIFDPGNFSYFLYSSNRVLDLRTIPVDHVHSVSGAGAVNAVNGSGLMVDAQNHLTGGTVKVLTVFSGPSTAFVGSLIGISVAVSALNAASATAAMDDDAALIQAALGGNDLVGLGAGADRFHSESGLDLVFGNGGNDRLWLGGGDDAGLGGLGGDKLLGQAGDDLLVGNEGRDRLYGDAGRDVVDGGKGDDLLSGGGGADRFIFVPGDGSDTITDFNAQQDIINIGAGPSRFGQLTLTQVGAATEVSFRNVTILLENVLTTDLGRHDFQFNANTSVTLLDHFGDLFDTKG